MRCLKCDNKKYFTFFFNQNFKVKFNTEKITKIKKEKLILSDVYPIVCNKCESMEVDFEYSKLNKIIKRASQ